MSNTVKCQDGIYRNISELEGMDTMGDYFADVERTDEEIDKAFDQAEEDAKNFLLWRAERMMDDDFGNDDYSEEGMP